VPFSTKATLVSWGLVLMISSLAIIESSDISFQKLSTTPA
jgi:hypothetical protein